MIMLIIIILLCLSDPLTLTFVRTQILQTEYHLPVQSVLSGSVETELCSSQSSPGDAVPGVVETAKGTLSTIDNNKVSMRY